MGRANASFVFYKEVGVEEFEYQVSGCVEPTVPTRGWGGPPENAYPAEGGDVEIMEIRFRDPVTGKYGEPIPESAWGDLFTEKEQDQMVESLQESVEDDYEDPPDEDPPGWYDNGY